MIADTQDGVSIGYDDLGNKADPPVILIGGLATQRTVWPDSLCDALVAGGYRAIRFDNRDMGESTWWDAPTGSALLALVQSPEPDPETLPYTVDDMAGDVIALMDYLELPKAHVVGMSLGGRIAQAIAATWPARTMSLVSMMSTTGSPDLPAATAEAMTALMTPPRDPYDVEAVTELAIMQQGVIGSPKYPMPDDHVRDVVALNFVRGNNPEGALRQWLASVGAGDRRESIAGIFAPTLVLHGRADPLVPMAAGEDTAANIPGAGLRLIEGWGHNIPPVIGPLLAEEMMRFWSTTGGDE